jgi:hypothetical protein
MDSKNYDSKSQYGFIDIFFFVLFITAIAIFMGLSIVSVIDKKINNVSINMPSIQPKIILNVDKDKNGNIKISHKNNNTISDNIEEFIVVDAQNIQNCDMKKLNNLDKENSTDNLAKQIATTTLVIDKSVPSGAESINIYNSNLSKPMFYGTDSDVLNNSDKINNHTYKTIHFLGQTIPIDDATTKGYNYWQYSDDINPNAIRYQRILSQNTKGLPPEDTRYKNIPVGWNYAFHNTPAFTP